jgi:acetate kinase
MNILVLNAGSASLKFEVIQADLDSATPDQGQKLISGAVEGIGENTTFVRERVCGGLTWCGLMLDGDRNLRTIDCEGRISTDNSRLHAYVIPVEEGLMIAREAI